MPLDDVKYKRYKEIKSLLNHSSSGIEYNKVISINILLILFNFEKITYGGIIKQFFKRLDFTSLRNVFQERSTVLTSGSFDDRQDCVDQINLTLKCLGNAGYLSLNNLNSLLNFSPIRAVKLCFFVAYKLRTKLTLKEHLHLASCLCYYSNCYDELEKQFSGMDLSKKKYVAFHSSFGIEALTTQFFRQRGIETFSLSHGLSYINYRKMVPIDIIGGENITAEKVIVWGESSKLDLISNFSFPEDNIKIGGNLKYAEKKVSVKKTFRCCLILLGRAIYDKGNKDILDIAYKLKQSSGIDFKIKLHPSLDREEYEKLANNLNLKLIPSNQTIVMALGSDQFDFAIVNNSNTYYESMYYGLLCFRYEPDENDIFFGLDDRFSDVNSILDKINLYQEMESAMLNQQVTNLLKFALGIGVNNYSKIIDGNE